MKVSLNALASVTAGFANDVEAVNQYAAVMYAPTAAATATGERRRDAPRMTATKPKVATASLHSNPAPRRTCCAMLKIGSPNMPCAIATPTTAPTTCTAT